jgi:hypothetical protein
LRCVAVNTDRSAQEIENEKEGQEDSTHQCLEN